MSYVLESKNVVIRKPHKCWGCGREFEKGSKLTFFKEVDAGDFKYSYWCKTCMTYSKSNMGTDEGIEFGDLKYEDPEGWEEVRKEIEG